MKTDKTLQEIFKDNDKLVNEFMEAIDNAKRKHADEYYKEHYKDRQPKRKTDGIYK